jgi:hypothetical protein
VALADVTAKRHATSDTAVYEDAELGVRNRGNAKLDPNTAALVAEVLSSS